MTDATAAAVAEATSQSIPPIRYDFPTVNGEIFLHAFCVLDAEKITVRTNMPDDFTYKQVNGSFHSNTGLFGNVHERTPAGRSIRYRSQCRGGTYMQPSHEYYRGTGEVKTAPSDGTPYFNDGNLRGSKGGDSGFSYNGRTFGLDIIPRLDMDTPDPVVTICAMVPEPSLFGQLTGGWDTALRDLGFKQGKFEDTGGIVWEMHCKEVSASDSAAAAEAAASGVVAPDPEADAAAAAATEPPKKKKLVLRNAPSWFHGRGGLPILTDKMDRHRPISTEDQRLRKLFLF